MVIFLIISCCSINLGGIISTSTVHQSFYFIADITVLFYLIHCFGVILSRHSGILYEELTGWFVSGEAAVHGPNVLWSTPPIKNPP